MKPSSYQYNKEASFNSIKIYNQFLNWVSGEFDLFLQDEAKGLSVFFPEGSFHIDNKKEKNTVIAHIKLSSKNPEKGEDILAKITSIYKLLIKIK